MPYTYTCPDFNKPAPTGGVECTSNGCCQKASNVGENYMVTYDQTAKSCRLGDMLTKCYKTKTADIGSLQVRKPAVVMRRKSKPK